MFALDREMQYGTIQGNVKIKSVFCQKSLMKVTGQSTAFNVKNNIFILDWNGRSCVC